jgi:hypothetical protein
MRDELEAPFLDEWLRETEVAPPDPKKASRQVASQLPHARQVGRWLPFSLFRREARAPTATPSDTAPFQPTPIPVTNGHTPTAIGRTQTMFSPVKAITAGALVFALGGLFLIAQPFDQQGSVPGVEQGAEPAPPVGVTITTSEGTEVGGEECTGDTRTACTRTSTEQYSASDPRLSGTATYRVTEYNWDEAPGNTIFEAHAIEVVNDQGRWVGTGQFIGPLDLFVLTLAGEGEYEGHTAVVTWDTSGEEDEEGMKAVIVDGGLPPFPEVPAAE